MKLPVPPICDYCGAPAIRKTGAEFYSHRPDLEDRVIWQCVPCRAWVGCHVGTDEPLGRLANASLRRAKRAAHAAFDPLWKAKIRREGCAKSTARGAGYKWLAAQLGIEREKCHIGMFDEETCWRVVRLCENLRPYVQDDGDRAA